MKLCFTNKLQVVIDLDLTLYDTDKGWFDWLNHVCDDFDFVRYQADLLADKVNYNLSVYFTLPEYLDPFLYWKDKDTYVHCETHRFARNVIKNLYEAGFEIVFCSYCMGCPEQIKYKLTRLKSEFDFLLPDDFNFIPTRKKGLLKGAHIIIDDRNEFLNQFGDDVLKIRYQTPYTQDHVIEGEVVDCSNWNKVEDVICEWMEENL
ncbi:putative 5'(3')-deoxyribonucleotidase [Vibrio phage RYC]|nr:putative 5'(3')-deoxyribonucleotidase [Vibrio phage RYC]